MTMGRKITFLLRIANEKGSVLLTTYLLITVLLLLGTAFLIASSNEGRAAESQRKITQAFYLAEAGVERMIYNLKKDFSADEDWSDDEINGWTYDSTDTDANGYFPFPDASDAANNAYPSTVLGDGSYSISLKSSGSDDIWIRSTGMVGSIRQTVRVYVRIVSLSPWDNAIFGGSGSSGGWVNGNVNVSGSVHILGDGLDPGDNAIDLGGTAELVRNNYTGLDPLLRAKVPALPTTDVGVDLGVETLNAELRVKRGLVGLSGSSSVGEPNVVGNTTKEKVDGVFVTDGYNGNQGSGNVYSDNGFSNAYDLGDAVTFPSLSDPYPDDPSKDYYEYFADNGLVLTNELAAVTPASSFTLGDCATNCVTMDGAGNMTVKGMIYVQSNNNLSLTGGTINYTGTGSILVTGNATIDVNLYTAGNNSFPTNILGIMTPKNINVGNSAQRDVMGLFYAEGEVRTAKQTDLMGTIVANHFNITDQVPSIYQVPKAAKNLPPGMIGGDPVNLIKVVSWQKIDNP